MTAVGTEASTLCVKAGSEASISLGPVTGRANREQAPLCKAAGRSRLRATGCRFHRPAMSRYHGRHATDDHRQQPSIPSANGARCHVAARAAGARPGHRRGACRCGRAPHADRVHDPAWAGNPPGTMPCWMAPARRLRRDQPAGVGGALRVRWRGAVQDRPGRRHDRRGLVDDARTIRRRDDRSGRDQRSRVVGR